MTRSDSTSARPAPRERAASPRVDDLFARALEQAPVALAALDRTGCFLLTNARFIELSGACTGTASAGPAVGAAPAEVLPADVAAAVERLVGQVLRGERATPEALDTDIGGTPRRLVLEAFEVRGTGGDSDAVGCLLTDESEQRRLERSLSTTATMMESLMREAPIGVAFLDTELRYVLINEALAEMNGIQAADHLGRSVPEMLPDLADTVVPLLRRVLETGEPLLDLEISGEIPAHPGDRREWRSGYYRVEGPNGPVGVGLIVADETERRRAQRRLRQLIDGLFTFVGLCKPDGTMLEANRTALDAAGITVADVLGKPFWDTYWWNHDPQVQAKLRDAIERAASGEMCRYDAEVRVADGELVTIDFQIVPLIDDGVVTALVPSAVDITDRERASRQLEATAAMAQRLSAAGTTDEVVAVVTGHGTRAIDADFVDIALLHDGGIVTVHHPEGVDDDIVERYGTLSLADPLPACDAIRMGRLVFASDPEDHDGRYRDVWPAARHLGNHAFAAVPLMHAGATIGALGVAWHDAHELDAADEARLAIVAKLCAQTLGRTLRGDQFEELVERLQHHLLPAVPAIEGLDVAVAYEPATEHLGFGGDWYDVIALDEHRTAFVVGDVAGHGIEAAAEMAQVRSTINALVRLGTPLDELLDRAHAPIGALGQPFVGTAVVSIIDTSTDTCSFVRAGHPPPVLRASDGRCSALDGANGPVLGIAPRRPIDSRTIAFPSGSTLVLCTDGLIERRRESIDVGIERLVQATSDSCGGPPDVVLAAITAALLPPGHARHDDVATIVVQRR